ncbi:MAG TPA: phospholipase D family protein [Pyrinomonadaceae bacterium]|nr:phospholipase D family protein [Pyrinomonadaceae bacterium]
MLDPETRRYTLEILRPPAGYELDRAIGTTFSLDLLALLTAPLAFTFFDWEDTEGRPTDDPLAILESLRRYADRISIFCQSGRIAVPHTHKLFTYLENSVFEVTAQVAGAVFHPKLWILRLVATDQPVVYRVLLPTRNLTFERCWDTVLVLEGQLVERNKAFTSNHPLADLVAALPRLTVRKVNTAINTSVDAMAEELRRVDFDIPEPFREMTFWTMGLNGAKRWPFQSRNRSFDRVLVMSPFVKDNCLSRLKGRRGQDVLISRADQLAALQPETLDAINEVLVLNPSAELHQGDDPDAVASGIHAKLYIAEEGGRTRVWTGSANATNAAFRGNIEFLVELLGDRNKCGINAFLTQTAEGASFRDLLQPFNPETEKIDAEREHLESVLDDVRCELATRRLTAKITAFDSLYTIDFEIDRKVELPDGVHITCRPLTQPEASAVPIKLGRGIIASFKAISFEGITSFYAFEMSITENKKTAKIAFVMNATLEGAPPDRQERILRSLLSDKGKVIRFILLLLAEGGADRNSILFALQKSLSGNGDDDHIAVMRFPLFEALVRTLDRNPRKLDQISRLVQDLKRTNIDVEVLPEGFEEIWEPIWQAREALRQP